MDVTTIVMLEPTIDRYKYDDKHLNNSHSWHIIRDKETEINFLK